MQSDRLSSSLSRAGIFPDYFTAAHYGPGRPWPNILSLGVTTISMDLTHTWKIFVGKPSFWHHISKTVLKIKVAFKKIILRLEGGIEPLCR